MYVGYSVDIVFRIVDKHLPDDYALERLMSSTYI